MLRDDMAGSAARPVAGRLAGGVPGAGAARDAGSGTIAAAVAAPGAWKTRSSRGSAWVRAAAGRPIAR